eukprot:Nitzschia sp. Nitz4//scaffold75_size92586//23752//24888//NITZ4_004846-RA/size92586-processed-gene-0.4-mRNA-1//1//CDS//3329557678//5801//frame0
MPDASEVINIVGESLQETSNKVLSALVPSIESFLSSEDFAPKDGLDVLNVKNMLLMSYLIDLVSFIRDQSNGEVNEKSLQRLNEMKVVLDKFRGLDKKLRYQIDKLLAANSSAADFASGGDNGPVDPLQFRPDPTALEGADDGDENDSDQGEAMDADDHADSDLRAARATLSLSKDNTKSSKEENDGIYRAPRQTAVPYTFDQEHKQKEKEKRDRRRLRSSELAQTLRSQYGDAPEQEDIHGGSDYGKQRAAARRLAEREAEKTKYEEDTMVRLQTSRKDKKEKKRLMREEGSNLAAISNLGNLVRETRAFGSSYGSDDEREAPMQEERGRHANGKRRREAINVDGASQGRKGKSPRPKNALQAALYNSGGKKKRSKK